MRELIVLVCCHAADTSAILAVRESGPFRRSGILYYEESRARCIFRGVWIYFNSGK